MAKFRKRPVVVEAVQLTWENWRAVCDFVSVPENGIGIIEDMPAIAMMVQTLEGPVKATEGDWIIKGVKGEFYPCKPDIFAMTYDPVEEESSDA